MAYDPRQYWQALGRLYSNFVRDKKPILAFENVATMRPLQAYRWDGGVLCMYRDPTDEQKAFNIVATAIGSESMPETAAAVPKWFHLPPAPDKDPLEVRGYIGARD